MVWTCAQCSYIDNNDARSRCEVCDAQKPPQAARAPTPVGPDWSCPLCTLRNSGREAKCTACGTDRPAAFSASRAAPPARPLPVSGASTPVARPSPSASPSPAAAARPSPSPAPVVRPSPSPSPVPALPSQPRSSTPTSSFQPGESDISFLTGMGFSRPQAVAALQASRSRDAALDLLLAQATASPPPKAAPAAAPGAAKPAAAATKPPVPASAAAGSKPAGAAAAAAAPAVKKLSPAEQRAFDEREAKRQALLKQLDEEAQAKAAAAKAKAAAAAAKAAPAASAPKKTTSAPTSASVISASAVAPVAAAPAAAPVLTEEQKKLASIQAEREAAAQRVAMAKLRVQKRLEAEQRLKSLPDVLAALRANYDPLRFSSIVAMLRKIVDKIIADQGRTDKFRRIPLDNPKLELVLVRPIGPIWILKQVGFEERVEKSSSGNSGASPTPMELDDGSEDGSQSSGSDGEQRVLVLDAKKVNLKALQQLLSTLAQQQAAQHSSIPALFSTMLSSQRYSVEQLYHLALELKQIVHNLVVSVDEIDDLRSTAGDAMDDVAGASSSRSSGRDTVNKNFRTIDKIEPAYQLRIKPVTESKAILAELGFGLDPHDHARQFLVVPAERMAQPGALAKYQMVLRELNDITAQLRTKTPIAQSLVRLCAQNRQKPMERFVEQLLTALRLIVNNRFEQKFYRIVLSKLQAKVGTKPGQEIKGMAEFVALFGFVPVPLPEGADPAEHAQAGRVALPFPADTELLAIRADELEFTWKRLIEQAAAESGGASSGWSFD